MITHIIHFEYKIRQTCLSYLTMCISGAMKILFQGFKGGSEAIKLLFHIFKGGGGSEAIKILFQGFKRGIWSYENTFPGIQEGVGVRTFVIGV